MASTTDTTWIARTALHASYFPVVVAKHAIYNAFPYHGYVVDHGCRVEHAAICRFVDEFEGGLRGIILAEVVAEVDAAGGAAVGAVCGALEELLGEGGFS